VDLVFRRGTLRDSTLVARKLFSYRHQLVASPTYLERHKPPEAPGDLHDHRLLAFSHWKPDNKWVFTDTKGESRETVTFVPFLAMNDYVGLATALVGGGGIGEIPPVVQPHLLREGRLVEVMPAWRFRTFDLSLVHLGNRQVSRPVRLFKAFAAEMARSLFPSLPD
jgi:DNA-binding transcriptional LysR family regulator